MAAAEGAGCSGAAGLAAARACAGLPQAGALGAAGLGVATAVGVSAFTRGVAFSCDAAAEVGVDEAAVATVPFA